jgi:alpha-beta hydrolase superfamily lysophospholipase
VVEKLHIVKPGKGGSVTVLHRAILAAVILLCLGGCDGPELSTWHTEKLTDEFSASDTNGVETFQDYVQLEDRLFEQLDRLVYDDNGTGPEHALERYSSGSKADPGQRHPNWNRSFELASEAPVGGVLLLHGMSDSPYSLRALGETLQTRGFQVLGLRMPGHGTAPSGLLHVDWEDMSAVVRLGMSHLADKVGNKPIHIIGYSTGAALALDFALQVEQGTAQPAPASLVLISPAIGLSPAAFLATWGRRLSHVPGLGRLAWLDVAPEFDPYKYNSFATNAAEQVYRLTSSVSDRIAARDNPPQPLPPILVLKSTVDATVSNNAVVDRLMLKLAPNRHEMVLFDINRIAGIASLLVDDPHPFTQRMIADEQLPFGLTLVTNKNTGSRTVEAFSKKPFGAEASEIEVLPQDWPHGVFSLSHVALPFPADDTLYGSTPPQDRDQLFLGQQALQGERGLLKIPDSFLLRLRHNPFYDYMERRVLEWLIPGTVY